MAPKHGLSSQPGLYNPTYNVWAQMRYRCNNPNHSQYADYGGRGITVCRRWDSFENFLADMGEKPVGLSIDRKNNNRGYSPANCRWATQVEQQSNKRSNRKVRVGKAYITCAEWARREGVSRQTIWKRLNLNH